MVLMGWGVCDVDEILRRFLGDGRGERMFGFNYDYKWMDER